MVKAAAALVLCFLTVAQATVYFQEKFDGACHECHQLSE